VRVLSLEFEGDRAAVRAQAVEAAVEAVLSRLE